MPGYIPCAVFGCSDKTSGRRRFPNPEVDPARFRKWILAIKNPKLYKLDKKKVYSNYRVCGLHFQEKDRKTLRILNRVCVPSVLLPDGEVNEDEVYSIESPRNSPISLPPGDNTPLEDINCPLPICEVNLEEPSIESNIPEERNTVEEIHENVCEVEIHKKEVVEQNIYGAEVSEGEIPDGNLSVDELKAQYWIEKNQREKEMHELLMKKEEELYDAHIESWKMKNKRMKLKLEVLEKRINLKCRINTNFSGRLKKRKQKEMKKNLLSQMETC